jgi:hypothetical protein
MAGRFKIRGAFKTKKAAARVGHDFILKRKIRGRVRYIPMYGKGRKR